MKALKTILIFFAVLAVLGVLIGGGLWIYTQKLAPSAKLVQEDKHQAIFISNGQVYFGKIKNLNKQYAELTNIYYLILKTPLQQQQPTEGETLPPQQPEYTLIKLGEELHGPIDRMVINRDHILFVEDLKENGKVSTAIKNYEAGGGQ